MHPLRRAHPFEFRTAHGTDLEITVDVWVNQDSTHAVLVLRGCPLADAGHALNTLSHTVLPYLLRPEVQLQVLALHPHRNGAKARALVLPLSA
ncbi:hypothetical protein [Deinococcus aerophilus]|uniref:Uncharacterized protein n=1 Tax=Deinococcus aerophilus TaxID=522488 RepID=A0ABQ2GGZ3_9DEIO|nr:hypothetical protein [Deinococcus aerophilus]GGL96016.1 hypothetical protein GCM10010841_00580 [Deinococcus aerophilus]